MAILPWTRQVLEIISGESPYGPCPGANSWRCLALRIKAKMIHTNAAMTAVTEPAMIQTAVIDTVMVPVVGGGCVDDVALVLFWQLVALEVDADLLVTFVVVKVAETQWQQSQMISWSDFRLASKLIFWADWFRMIHCLHNKVIMHVACQNTLPIPRPGSNSMPVNA